ncbi:MAG: hypothetical protein COV52_09690 [Gammaproteobacteria bacterium CG11_big_fil_rev_8_21_14_0_20_46_22]|nr:MAG: hypothetical protein COV52_09690 [Gammaproteobacteria bacterium CG11_big_fil_rev_8_21_14_0_20_46_22]
MSIEIENKLQFLHQAWPSNAILTTSALKAKGFSDQLIQKYCHSGWLQRIGIGAFVRQNDKASWQGGLYAIQHDLKKNIHIGGLTALELSGLAHYLGLAPEKIIYLYNTSSTKSKLPGWFIKYFNQKEIFHYKQCHIFDKEIGLKTQAIESLEILVSEPERAILELLYLVPEIVSVEHAANLVENLQTIRPEKMQHMLENCRHILIKRLFLCLSDLCQLPVLKHLRTNKITLGSGDRTINVGGKYFPKYKLVLSYSGSGDLEEDINV